MAANPIMATSLAVSHLDNIDAQLGSGALLRIYDNTGTVPLACNAGNGTNVLLAELAAAAQMFAPASGAAGAATATMALTATISDTSANATGTAAYYRLYESTGTTCYWQDTVGTSGEGLNLDSVSIVAGGTVTVTALTLTQPTGK